MAGPFSVADELGLPNGTLPRAAAEAGGAGTIDDDT
jgi:hypothetical protein